MVELVIGKTYRTDELIKELGVSRSVFSHKKDKYLDSLSRAYKYEVTCKGRANLYTIIEKIGDYEKPQKEMQEKKNDAVIHDFIKEVIEEDNLQTAANISRKAVGETNSKVVELGLKESTIRKYVRTNMKKMFGTKIYEGGTDGCFEEKVWCKLNKKDNVYEELSDDIIQEFYNTFDEVKSEIKREDIEILEDYYNDLITKEEFLEKIGDYNINLYSMVRRSFVNKYGFYPIKVPRYLLQGYRLDFEK